MKKMQILLLHIQFGHEKEVQVKKLWKKHYVLGNQKDLKE